MSTCVNPMLATSISRPLRAIPLSLLLLLSLLLVGCSVSGGAAAAPATTASVPLAATRTSAPPTATATVTQLPVGEFVCPTTTSGATKTFTVAQFGLSFSYPAAWTEHDCSRINASTILIGNLFFVSTIPREGRSIAQWVAATKSPDEDVALSPLDDPYAVEAAQVAVTFPNGPGATPAGEQPLVQVLAVVAGTWNFYVVYDILAQMSMTDTIPPQGELVQVIATFREI